jgi:hypothetical protein
MISATPASKLNHERDSESQSCDHVCPCCKERRCSGAASHRNLPKSEKDHWHRCDCGVCPVW